MGKYVYKPVEVLAKVIIEVNQDDCHQITLEDGSLEVLTEGMIARYEPKAGDYFVTQPDGYQYINPKAVFEAKFTEYCETNIFSFGEAIKHLKQDKKVARLGWNGKGMWLCLQSPDKHSKMGHPYIYMKAVDGKLFPWNPNNLDMLSEDWEVVA